MKKELSDLVRDGKKLLFSGIWIEPETIAYLGKLKQLGKDPVVKAVYMGEGREEPFHIIYPWEHSFSFDVTVEFRDEKNRIEVEEFLREHSLDSVDSYLRFSCCNHDGDGRYDHKTSDSRIRVWFKPFKYVETK